MIAWCMAWNTPALRHSEISACATAHDLMGGFSKAYAMTGWRLGISRAAASQNYGRRAQNSPVIMQLCRQIQPCRNMRPSKPYSGESLRSSVDVYEYDRRRRSLSMVFRQIGLPTFEP